MSIRTWCASCGSEDVRCEEVDDINLWYAGLLTLFGMIPILGVKSKKEVWVCNVCGSDDIYSQKVD
jgi:hypothetical protein